MINVRVVAWDDINKSALCRFTRKGWKIASVKWVRGPVDRIFRLVYMYEARKLVNQGLKDLKL